MERNPLLAEKRLAFATRCHSMPSSMQKSSSFSCLTITYEEALKRELEYRRRLESTHPHLLIAVDGAPELAKTMFFVDNLPEVGTHSTPDVFKRKPDPESSVPSPQANFSFTTVRSQPTNWYPSKKKVKVQQPLPPQAVQMPRSNLVPSFWCKICKVDCVTEFNFNAHIGGKKHKAKKLEILGNRNSGRPGSQFGGKRNAGRNGIAVSGSINDQPYAGSSSLGPSNNLTSVNGSNENGRSTPLVNKLQIRQQSDDNINAPCSLSSEKHIDMFSFQTTKESSSDGAGPSNSGPDENLGSAVSESSTQFAQLSDTKDHPEMIGAS